VEQRRHQLARVLAACADVLLDAVKKAPPAMALQLGRSSWSELTGVT
jgi:hypothetical protein